MKTKFKFLCWLLALVPLAFTACDDDDVIIEDTTIETSVQTVTFTKDGGNQSVTVTTTALKWIATSPAEGQWLTLSQSGNQLNIQAAANDTDADRKSHILLNAGNTAAKIEIMQSAGDVAFFLTPENVSFGKEGGQQRIDVIGSHNFTLEVESGAAEWLTTDYQNGADFFHITVAEGTETRTGKVIVTAGSLVKELIVTQTVTSEAFILPYMSLPANYTAAFQFELQRGHALSNVPQLFGNQYYEFSTGNADCPLLGYWYTAPAQDETYSQAAALYTNTALFTDDEGAAFKAFMEEKGFTYNEGANQFEHAELPFIVNYSLQDGVVQVNAIYQPKQKGPQPTFSEIPTINRKQLLSCPEADIHGGTLEDAAKWEAEHGGTYSEEESSPADDYTCYMVADHKEGLTQRAYWDDKVTPDFTGEITATQDIYTDLSRIYYVDEGTGNMYLTEEFQKLMADNKFIFLGDQNGFQFYGNGEIQLAMMKFEIRPGETVVQFQGMKIGAAPAVKDILLDSNVRHSYLQEVSARFERLNKHNIQVPLR